MQSPWAQTVAGGGQGMGERAGWVEVGKEGDMGTSVIVSTIKECSYTFSDATNCLFPD